MMDGQWKNSLGICSANMRMHWRSASISPWGVTLMRCLLASKWMFNQWWKYIIGSSGMMRLVVFSSLYRQMIHRPPKLNMEHMEPEAVPMLFKFGLSLSRIWGWGGGRTNQPTNHMEMTCGKHAESVCLTARQLICMDTVRWWHFGVAAGGRSSALLVFPIIKWVSLSINTCQRLEWVG